MKQRHMITLGGAFYENNELRFISIPGGRLRRNANGKFVFDYFIADHLGNIRTVLTEETSELGYWATHEQSPNPKPAIPESELFTFPVAPENISATNKLYNYGGDNKQCIRLKATNTTPQIGTGKTLKVMAGDKVDLLSMYYYQQNSPANNAPNLTPNSIINQFVGALLGPVSAVDGKASLVRSDGNGLIINKDDLGTFITNEQANNQSSDIPKAYLNYALFDENFKFVDGGAKRVATPDVVGQLTGQMTVRKNGYLYVYLSNESPTDVYFDNLVIKHTPGPLLQEDTYYPFGLQIAALSSKALGRLQNNNLFNGIEKIDDLDLGIYDAHYRTLDPQIGRWWQVDPKSTANLANSPYVLSGNNPVNYKDPLGDDWFANGKGALIYLDGVKDTRVKINGELYYNVGMKVSFKVGDAIYSYYGSTLTILSPDKLLGNEVIKQGMNIGMAQFGKITLAKKLLERDQRLAKNPHEKGTFTHWYYIHGIEYDTQFDAYHGWWSYPNYHEGESPDQFHSRFASYGCYEARREFASGGYNMFGGAGSLEGMIQSTIEASEMAAVEVAEVSAVEVVAETTSKVIPVAEMGTQIEYLGGTDVKLLEQFSSKTIDDAVNTVMKDPNKVKHLFPAKHNLEPLVEELGGQENTVRAVLNSANGKLPSSGVFRDIPVNVNGYNVMIRGNVINGVPRLGTMFIP